MHLQSLLNWTETSPDVDENPIFPLLELLSGDKALDASQDTLESIPVSLFDVIRKWVETRQPKRLSNALTIWTKWFSLPTNFLPTQSILCDPEQRYFDVLQLSLQDSLGHPGLQKYALYVLRRSMLLLEGDVHSDAFDFEMEGKMNYVAEYNKYCSLFETIVIGRSVNQAEECLLQVPKFGQRMQEDEKEVQSNGDGRVVPDSDLLETMATTTQEKLSGHPLVRQTWWTILFGAGLIQSNSEAIRKLLGEFVFQNYFPTGDPGWHSCNSYKLFLAGQLLPWAMQGQLFTRSIQRSGKNIISAHGEALAEFCKRLTLCQSNQTAGMYTTTVLKYLVDNSNNLNPHAALYVLQGLDVNHSWEVTLEDAEQAVDLPYKTAFSQIQRVVMLRHCIAIVLRLDLTKNEPSANEVQRQKHLQSRLTTLQHLMGEESKRYLDKNQFIPRNFKDQNLDANGESGRISFTHLESQKSMADLHQNAFPNWADIQSSNWTALVDGDTQQAQWAETPKQFLGLQCLSIVAKIATSQSEVVGYAADYVEKLFDLVSGKTFMWRPLAEALRNAYFYFPEILQNSNNSKILFDNAKVLNLLEHRQIEDVILRFVNDPPSPRPEFLLDAGITSRELDENNQHIFNVFADETTGHACIFDMLNRLRPSDADWGLRLLDRILQPWLEQKEPVAMVAKWKRTAQTQAMIILFESCLHTLEEAQKYWDEICTILALEPHPRFRFLLEWILVSLSQHITNLVNASGRNLSDHTGLSITIAALKSADHSNPKHISALIKVAMQLALNPPASVPTKANPKMLGTSSDHENMTRTTGSTGQSPAELLNLNLMTELIALSASPKIPIRHEAQWSFPILFEHCERSGHTSITQNPAFAAMNTFIKTLDKYNFPPEAKILGSFNTKNDSNLATLFEGGYLRIHPSELPLLHVEDFEELWAKDAEDSLSMKMPPPSLPLGKWERRKLEHATPPSRDVNIRKEEAAASLTAKDLLPATPAPLQTKSLALDSSFTSLTLDEAPQQSPSNGPILIASLIVNPHNLGGLSRASEIFGCTSLFVPDLSVLKNQQFRNVSVNSELHIRTEELKEGHLVAWLRGMKNGGWTVVGVEQTNTSIVIGIPNSMEKDREEKISKTLPKKSIIIMGAEKTGITAEVLVECDICVEIKQWGITRSLNVQTAAACVLFEWRRIWGDGREVSK